MIKGSKALAKYGENNEISEKYPTYSPYSYFETVYYSTYAEYKRKPDAYNKGKLDMLDIILNEMLGQKAKSIKSSTQTKYANRKQ